MTDQVIHVVARLVPRPAKAAALASAIRDILVEVRGEAGCLLTTLTRAAMRPA